MPKQHREPARTCVACRQEAAKSALVRVVRRPDGTAALDPGGRATGRGAYLHRDASCVDIARKRRQLERSLGATVGPEFWSELTA